MSARHEEELDLLALELRLPSDHRLVLPLDLEAHEYDFKRKVDLVLERFDQIDVLINNDGVSERCLIKNTLRKIDSRLININYLGTITLSKAVLSVLRKNNLFYLTTLQFSF